MMHHVVLGQELKRWDSSSLPVVVHQWWGNIQVLVATDREPPRQLLGAHKPRSDQLPEKAWQTIEAKPVPLLLRHVAAV